MLIDKSNSCGFSRLVKLEVMCSDFCLSETISISLSVTHPCLTALPVLSEAR